jgi:DNA polymerase-3 subunit delta
MQLKPPQLADHLSQHLAPCYLISGDEPLIVQECADAIRAAARAAGCTERQRISISSKDDWLELGHSAGSLSLFADRKLIEVQLPSGKPGTEGSKAIQEYLAGDQEDVLLIVSGRIDKQSHKSKWYVALDQAGVILPVWPISPAELPGWIAARMKTAGLTADNDAVTLLAERLEGNLLAASQEIEKLRLLHGEQTITAELWQTPCRITPATTRFGWSTLHCREIAGAPCGHCAGCGPSPFNRPCCYGPSRGKFGCLRI